MPTRTTGRKSERTRAAILAAARDHFSRHPYDKASLRAIAADAGIDPSLIVRYFTNKETLFAATVDVDLRLPDLRQVPVRRRGAVLAAHFVEQWEGPERNEALPIIVRSALTHELAAEHVRSIFADQVRQVVTRASGRKGAAQRAGLISSQLLGVAIARYLLRLPGVTEMNAPDLVDHLSPTLQRYLTLEIR